MGIIDQEADMLMGLRCSKYKERFGYHDVLASDEATLSVRKHLNSTVLPRHLGFYEQLLDASATGWLANTEGPSIADFVTVLAFEWLGSGTMDGIDADIISKRP